MSELSDLTRLAQHRTRDAAKLVLQLIDDEDQRTAVLMAVTVYFIEGVAMSIRDSADDPMDDEEALAHAIGLVIRALGIDRVNEAFRRMNSQKKPRKRTEVANDK